MKEYQGTIVLKELPPGYRTCGEYELDYHMHINRIEEAVWIVSYDFIGTKLQLAVPEE